VTRRLRWGVPEVEAPKRPYRDTFVFYLVLAALIVVVAWLTGGDVAHAVKWAAAFFAVATAWSFVQWRRRLARDRANDEERRMRSGEEPVP
jgi:membrane protein implicated in regulation of membrane protease activity